MKILLLFLTFSLVVFLGWSQTHTDAWIHSYVKLKTHWDPTEISIEVRTCIRQETNLTTTAPGEGYYELYQGIDPSDITYTLSIDGIPIVFNGSAIVTNFALGSTVSLTLLAELPGYPDYEFDADLLIDPINPSITYNTVPNTTVFNEPVSLLRTVKGDAGGCNGELNLNISGGYPFTGTNPYAIHYDNPTNYHLDYLHNLCSNTNVAYKWGDDWWGCKGNFCDPNISSNCSPSSGFCNNDGFFCDEILIEPRSCSLNDIIGQSYYCENEMVDFELVSDPGSSSYMTSFAGGGNFLDIFSPNENFSAILASNSQSNMATVTHLDGSVFQCYAALNVDEGYPYLDLLSDSLSICLGDTLIFDAGASWNFGVNDNYEYTLYGNQITSTSNNIIIATDSAGVFDLTLNHVLSDMGCIEPAGISIQFEVIDCDSLEHPIAGFECLNSNVICMDSCISFVSSSLYGSNPSFEWDFGNGQSHLNENINDPVCYNESGYYTVSLTVTDDNGSDTYYYALQVINCDPANLEQVGNNAVDFNLYPNPTNAEFTVSIESTKPENFKVFIYDVLGNRIESRILFITDKQQLDFNLDKYSNGIYYVELQGAESSLVKKIVLNK